MTIGLKSPTYALLVSSKFVGGSCSPDVRCVEVAKFYVDVLDFFSDKKKFQGSVRDWNFLNARV